MVIHNDSRVFTTDRSDAESAEPKYKFSRILFGCTPNTLLRLFFSILTFLLMQHLFEGGSGWRKAFYSNCIFIIYVPFEMSFPLLPSALLNGKISHPIRRNAVLDVNNMIRENSLPININQQASNTKRKHEEVNDNHLTKKKTIEHQTKGI